MARSNGFNPTSCVRSNLLTIMTIAGVVGGSIVGLILRSASYSKPWTERDVMYLQFPGDIFLQMLRCLIVPLLMSSIISAIGSLDLSLSKKIAFRSIMLYSTTTICAVILGIILVVTIRPGVGRTYNPHEQTNDKYTRNVLTVDTLMDLIRNMFPPNIVQSTMSQYRTVLQPKKDSTNQFEKENLTDYEIKSEWSNSTNVLGLVVFSIAFGIAIGKMGLRGRPILDFFESSAEATMIITRWVIWFSPIGVFFLVTAKILEIKSLQEIVGQLGVYFVTVLLGLFIHGLGTLSIIFFILTRQFPFKFLAGMGQVIATAFGTASSSATMPVTIEYMDKQKIDCRISRFVIPIGATINMDGTALYEAVAAIFIAQIRKIPLSFGRIIAVSITATAASIGAAGIPQAGLVTMVMVLDTVGLPAEDVTLIIAVDWLLDRFRTTINVMCDAMVAKMVDTLSRDELAKLKYGDVHEMEEMANNAEHLETRKY